MEQVFEVALALRYPNPRVMLEEMDRDTFIYWVAYLNRRKRTHDLKDYQMAQLTKIVAEMFAKGHGKPLDKYLIKLQTEEERLEEQLEENWNYFNSLPLPPGTKVERIE